MKAVLYDRPGGPEVLHLSDIEDPVAGEDDLVVRTCSVGVNGADLLQRKGLYPVPPGASEILGLEVAGEVLEIGRGVTGWKKGDRVMALLSGGGYAEKVAFPASLAMPVPTNISLEIAGGIPEVFLTAYLELVMLGGLRAGETVLIHAGASGVGTAAIQIARVLGARVLVTASSSEKLERCAALGARVLINYRTEDFAAKVLEATDGRGVDCILDLVGATHWAGNAKAIAVGGRWLLVGLGGGAKAEVDLRQLLNKRVQVIGSTLRARSLSEKAELTRRFVEFGLPRLSSGALTAVVDRTYPIAEAAEAHRFVESHANIGKVILTAAPPT